jgi:hypothetical protein
MEWSGRRLLERKRRRKQMNETWIFVGGVALGGILVAVVGTILENK